MLPQRSVRSRSDAGENPEGFNPERFAPGRSDEHPHYAYLPFGGGPSECIGKGFALLEAGGSRRHDVLYNHSRPTMLRRLGSPQRRAPYDIHASSRGGHLRRPLTPLGYGGEDAPLSISQPTTPAITDAAKMPILATSTSGLSGKARSEMKRLMVKPIPASQPAP